MVINHLTRMRSGHICVAGLQDGQHIRPIRPHGHWSRRHLAPPFGFAVGAEVTLGATQPAGSAPEVEDVRVQTEASVTSVRRLRDDEFWDLLNAAAVNSTSAIFGGTITRGRGGSAFVPLGQGIASLGCLRASAAELIIGGDRVRVEMADPELGTLNLSLTDLRICDADHRPVRARAVTVAKRLAMGGDVILSVGLSRPFAPAGGDAACHWLQINNIHFPDYFDDHPAFLATTPS